jgi:L-iditol 2-dehydrogenase
VPACPILFFLELTRVTRLPDRITAAEGALLEPLSVAIHGVRRAALGPGSNVLVLGAGPVGLLLAAMLRVEKASKITIADIEQQRVDFATVNGFADRGVVVPRTGTPSDDTTTKLNNAKKTAELLTGGEEFDAVFECTGIESCVQSAIYSTAPSGKVMIIGMGNPVQTSPLSAAALREVDIVGVFRYTDTYRYGIEVLAKKDEVNLPDITKLVTHTFSGFKNVPQAFAAAARTTDDDGNLVLKVIIET